MVVFPISHSVKFDIGVCLEFRFRSSLRASDATALHLQGISSYSLPLPRSAGPQRLKENSQLQDPPSSSLCR